MKFKSLISLFAGIGLLSMASVGQAAPKDLDNDACPDDSVYIAVGNVTGDTGGSDACFGAFDGNDPNNDGIKTGGTTFDFIAKSDMNNGAVPSPTGEDIGLKVTFGDACTTTTGADDNGCWSFTGLPDGYNGDFIIVIKAASSPGWGAYLFSTNNDQRSGKWQVAWAGGQNPSCEASTPTADRSCASVSHISIYAAKGGTTVAEPGTLALLGIGLLGLGMSRRRRAAD